MSPETTHYFNLLVGSGSILLQVLSIVALLLLFIGSNRNVYLDFIQRHYIVLGFIISVLASLASLIYSEIIGFLPCYLCWYQRIFIYPMVFLFGASMYWKDGSVKRYALPLLVAGLIISIYHNILYYFGEASTLPCDASGVSCFQRLVSEFGGYISIPMMSLTTFVALITLILVARYFKRDN